MTRFWITLEQGVRFVMRCIEQMQGGEVFVPKIPSMDIVDLARTIAPNCAIEEIGIRPGEKLHEVLVAEDEARQTLELDDMYVVQPNHPWWLEGRWKEGKSLPDGFRYGSDTNKQYLLPHELETLLAELL
jgi:UDP-N-acetylglucosamine 4,6-dehydratase